ncbi:rhodanese-like domain-containing protein [Pigmentiphaga sp. GD03639]|uniref:rhodanese-like domain-containing protein n=1 Tax=unclassified Pigmentiphaga TaxID=2626614 RepID=UPI00104886F6|nr:MULTISPECIES: rhodanese-like domain-containing protein [unclassified Pigmentiphaga]MDH2237875.1 rhodanese-like domain-containing protein [Pigmentiphaga sp. GD03639]
MNMPGQERIVTPAELRARLRRDGELALVDVREELPFSRGHLLQARCIALSRLEVLMPQRIPRRSTPIVLCADAALNQRARGRLASLGYTDVSALEGGIEGWARASLPVFSGVNVPSKAFGEFVEHAYRTPSIDAKELQRLLDARANVKVFDSRPYDDYTAETIPTSTSAPGAELAFRVPAAIVNDDTLVVVNCAGRTRSILGAQSIINAGLPQRVVALRNGTMGWRLAGLAVETGAERRLAAPSPQAAQASRMAAQRFADAAGVREADLPMLHQWLDEREARTLYALDVRTPDEAARDPLPGTLSAPGGQLVQATDLYVGTLQSRIVLLDPEHTRALMTGAWLRCMGWRDVYVAPPHRVRDMAALLATRPAPLPTPASPGLDAAEAQAYMQAMDVTVLDLSWSRHYKRRHVPGAVFASRSHLDTALNAHAGSAGYLLTCEDGRVSGFALAEAQALTRKPVHYLAGGIAAWSAAGLPLTSDEQHWSVEPEDVWLRPFERSTQTRQAMDEYLSWEVDLLEQARLDGSLNFQAYAPQRPT